MSHYPPRLVKAPSPYREGVLDQIVQNRAREIAREKRLDQPLSQSPTKRQKPLNLSSVLSRPGHRFIFEYKKASPSFGTLTSGLDIQRLARTYAPFADAISVLTEKKYFKGSFRDLSLVRASVNIPILCKDFFIDEIQVLAAYNAGADAILLMLSILDDKTYLHLQNCATALGLEILTEVHTGQEMVRAKALGAKLIGINNRNLDTMDISLETTERLAKSSPKDALLISESGITSRADVLRLGGYVSGFLVGSALMQSTNRELLIRQLVFGDVKICGLTRKSDAREAYKYGATYGGLNFVKGTPRYIFPSRARRLKHNIPLRWVGVFRHKSPEQIAHIASYLGLFAIQLHGDETSVYRARLRGLLPKGCEIWQAVSLSGLAISKYLPHADRFLFDTRTKNQFGGTGQTFNWSYLKDLNISTGFGLAGGINESNILDALATGATLIDICSGVEASPGIKSKEKLKALFQTIRKFKGRVTRRC